jgi:DHA1 family multidrug resistance protein-like MFS transporter
MAISFINDIKKVWARQNHNWRTIVKRQIFNRFFNELSLQYANIYITILGATPVQLGMVNSTIGVAQSMISIPLGVIRDRFNLRKIYLLGLAMTVFVPLIYAIAHSWQLIIVAVLISGLGSLIGSCVVICDLSLPPSDRATGKALCEGVGALPSILAPTSAAALLTMFGGISVQSISKIYWIQFFALILMFLYVFRNLRDVERPSINQVKLDIVRDFLEIFKKGTAIKRWLLFQSARMFAWTMMLTFQYPYIYEVKGASQFVIGGTATAMLITEVLFSTVAGRFADSVGRKNAFYLLIPFYTLANILLVFAPGHQWIMFAGFLLGFRTISSVIYGSMTPELVSPDYIGRWRGLIGFFTGLANIPAPIVGGFIWERFGPEWVILSVIAIELFVQTPLLYSVPETLRK